MVNILTRSLLDRCIIFATEKHAGQLDKGGLPYILHPLRVMLDPSMDTEAKQCVAVLHDVLEDTDATKAEIIWLTESRDITNSVILLTHEKNEPNLSYWNNILLDPTGVARCVKLADIRDNLSPSRLSVLPQQDQERLRKKYAKALEVLNQKE